MEHQNSVDEKKSAYKEIFGRLHEVPLQPISNKGNVNGGVRFEKMSPGHGTSTKTQGALKDERVHATKQAWVAKSHVSNDKKPQQESDILDEKVPKTDMLQAQEQTFPSPTIVENKTMDVKITPSQRDDLPSIDNKVNKYLSSSRNQEVKKTSLKQKQVLKEDEKAKRQRLHRSLQNLKPQMSSHGHHPAASSTPVLFHEVTYLLNSSVPARPIKIKSSIPTALIVKPFREQNL